jgi:abortive infection bacteriophage resistance protein
MKLPEDPKTFPKVAKAFEEQLAILKERGLSVSSDEAALRWLRRVSYYRLSAYFPTFRASAIGEQFSPGALFDELIDLYVFDCRLRSIFMIAIERIEISFRTTITYELAHLHGPFGHTLPDAYSAWFMNVARSGEPPPFEEFMKNIEKEEKRGKELFIKAYRGKYTAEKHLPIWMATELMSLGTLSIMFEGLKSSTKTKIAAQYKLAERPFQSWMHVLSSIRNLIAHHSRLWNRQLGVQPVIPHGWIYKVPKPDRIYSVAVMIRHLLSVIATGSNWQERLLMLVDRHPQIKLEYMGFPDNWRTIPPWKK